MPIRVAGGSGGGGGLILGPAQNAFTAATKAAAETLRDNYASANAAWLAQYDAEATFNIQISWPATPTNTVYQARRAGSWADVTGLLRGPMGNVGAQARFDVFCYDTAATAPTAPTGGTYNLATGVLTVPTGTTAAPVEPPTNQFSWRSQAVINPATQSGSVTPTWSAFTTDVEEGLTARAEAAETGAETAQTAAEAAQTAAVAAQTAAETAETGAEAAETRAEAAQSGAETALAGSGAALAFNELWSGDLLLSAANQWHALGTEAVPSNATWLLWNGGTLTDGTNDGPAALWTWINAADWRALTADTVGTTAGDGTGMLFADWCASDIGDGTPDFTRRDAVIGRTSADIPLLMGPQTGESYFGARLMYITQAVATPGGDGGASSFADLTGMIADTQVPAAFTRDTELASLVDNITISGTTLTITLQDGSTETRTLPSGAGGLDIAAYSSSATYSRGSDNSIVTHSSGLYIYVSSTERSSDHDPDTHPGYWLELSEGVTYMVISSGSHRIAARTLVVDGATDQVYLCTTTQTTPRDLTYIKAQADTIGGTFIELTAMIATTWKGPHVIGSGRTRRATG